MYTVTFYSYKGGVGRTLSLVNSAYELASKGKKVLIADFDLEAPGIHTFPIMNCKSDHAGIVDYIRKYKVTSIAEPIENYIQKCNVDSIEGEIYFLSGGAATDNYGKNLQEINWFDLYENFSGYELFEDIKLQIEKKYEIDYLLIDSRTGQTDVGGICTRHLPDLVCIIFHPNDQNLTGLTNIVENIKRNPANSKNISISTIFVASNVPDLDDESGILKKRLLSFKPIMEKDEPDIIITHYPSLELLDQQIFTKDRPKTKLAKQYSYLVEKITEHNHEDRDGSILFLKNKMKTNARAESDDTSASTVRDDEHIRFIEQFHAKDGEVLFQIGKYNESIGNVDKALQLYNRASEAGYEFGELYGRRASLLFLSQEKEKAIDDCWRILNLKISTARDILHAVYLIREESPNEMKGIISSESYKNASIALKIRILSVFDQGSKSIETAAYELLAIREKYAKEWPSEGNLTLAHYLIHIGKFATALNIISEMEKKDGNYFDDLTINFNKGIAKWGADKKFDSSLFERVVDLFENKLRFPPESANFYQCMALSYWVAGNPDTADRFLNKAIELIEKYGGRELSAWSYSEVEPSEFKEHIEEMRNCFASAKVTKFFRFKKTSEC